MKTMQISGLIGAVLALASTPALAQSVPATNTSSADVAVLGRVASLCMLGTPSSSEINVGQMAATSGTRIGKIAVIGAQSVNLDGSFCNFGGTKLTVDATAMTNQDDGAAAPQPSFARAVNFTATASNWAATNAISTTNALVDGSSPSATGFGGTQGVPKLASIGLQVSSFTVPGDSLLVAGAYRGAVRVTLGPAE